MNFLIFFCFSIFKYFQSIAILAFLSILPPLPRRTPHRGALLYLPNCSWPCPPHGGLTAPPWWFLLVPKTWLLLLLHLPNFLHFLPCCCFSCWRIKKRPLPLLTPLPAPLSLPLPTLFVPNESKNLWLFLWMAGAALIGKSRSMSSTLFHVLEK